MAQASQQVSQYDLDQFIADARATLAKDPGPAGREQVRLDLEKLLANPDFISAYCGDDQPRGLKLLYEDPKLGFQVLAHINDKARVSPPHDHGASWAIYGQATKYTDMTEWEREDDGSDPKHAKLKVEDQVPADAGPRRHLSGRRHSLHRLSRLCALRARHRHQSRQHQPHQDRPEERRGRADDAAAGDLTNASLYLSPRAGRGRRSSEARTSGEGASPRFSALQKRPLTRLVFR